MNCDLTIVQKDVAHALSEDVGSGDITASLLPANVELKAKVISREPCVVAGQPWFDAVFHAVHPEINIKWLVDEGVYQSQPTTLCELSGEGRAILTAERTALNFLQTLSATATQTYHYCQRIKQYPTKLLDTRKTLPGLRYAQKYAVKMGGGVNHRFGLYDALLIKENHIKACGSITAAIHQGRSYYQGVFLEVEVETLDELQEALLAKPDRILLDNFSLVDLEKAAVMNKDHGCMLEASGGVSLETIASIAATGVDFISVGAITKSIQAIDLSLLVI